MALEESTGPSREGWVHGVQKDNFICTRHMFLELAVLTRLLATCPTNRKPGGQSVPVAVLLCCPAIAPGPQHQENVNCQNETRPLLIKYILKRVTWNPKSRNCWIKIKRCMTCQGSHTNRQENRFFIPVSWIGQGIISDVIRCCCCCWWWCDDDNDDDSSNYRGTVFELNATSMDSWSFISTFPADGHWTLSRASWMQSAFSCIFLTPIWILHSRTLLCLNMASCTFLSCFPNYNVV